MQEARQSARRRIAGRQETRTGRGYFQNAVIARGASAVNRRRLGSVATFI
jgi:hypothetical protein